jgi:hypothetical protein
MPEYVEIFIDSKFYGFDEFIERFREFSKGSGISVSYRRLQYQSILKFYNEKLSAALYLSDKDVELIKKFVDEFNSTPQQKTRQEIKDKELSKFFGIN